MTIMMDGHIRVDDAGVARIADSRVKVIHLVMDRMQHGQDPEQMQQQFPSLSLAQIYAAFAYYHDHRIEIDQQIQESLIQADQLRAAATAQPQRDDLRRRLP